MNSDLQEKLARRRRMAESKQEDSSPVSSPVKEELKKAQMSPEMQAAMDRRRKLNREDLPSPPLEGRASLDSVVSASSSRNKNSEEASVGSRVQHRRKKSNESLDEQKKHHRRRSSDDVSLSESVESKSSRRGGTRRKSRDSALERSLESLEGSVTRTKDSDERSRASTRSSRRRSDGAPRKSTGSVQSDDSNRKSSSKRDAMKKAASSRSLESDDVSADSAERSSKREAMKKAASSRSMSSTENSIDSPSKPRRGKRETVSKKTPDAGDEKLRAKTSVEQAREFQDRKTRSKSTPDKASAPALKEAKSLDQGLLPEASEFPSSFDQIPKAKSSEAAFGSFAPDFGADFKSDFGSNDAFGTNAFASFDDTAFANTSEVVSKSDFEGDAAGFDPFDKPMFSSDMFAAKSEPEWDTSRLKDVPTLENQKPSVELKTIHLRSFVCEPVTNPVNNNVIYCESTRDSVYIREVDPSRSNVIVASTELLTQDLRKKIATKYTVSVYAIGTIKRLVAGLHKVHGERRARVALFLNVYVLERDDPMPLIVVWQWGYGSSGSIAVQQVMSPPKDGKCDPKSIQIADSLLFLAGRSGKEQCIFLRYNDAWTPCAVPGLSGEITSISINATCDRNSPLLAISTSDQSLSLWNYRNALNSKVDSDSSLLVPTLRLETTTIFEKLEPSPLPGDKSSSGNKSSIGQCTSMDWIYLSTVDSAGMLFLSVTFQGALSLYRISIPAQYNRASKSIEVLDKVLALDRVPYVRPFVAKVWQGKHDFACSRWVDLGPSTGPALLLINRASASDNSVCRLSLGLVSIPPYAKGRTTKDALLPFRIVSGAMMVSNSVTALPSGFAGSRDLPGVYVYGTDRISGVRFVSSVQSDILRSYRYPVTSFPGGLDTFGVPMLVDTSTDKEGVLSIFSSINSERSMRDDGILEWGTPVHRFWLFMTLVGDTKAAGAMSTSSPNSESAGFGDEEVVNGGATTKVITELQLDTDTAALPCRLVRSSTSEVCAVLFREGLSSKVTAKEGISEDAHSIYIVDYSGKSPRQRMVEGRDIAFFPSSDQEDPQGLILSKDGSSLTHFTWDGGHLQLGDSYRPILGVEIDENFVECKRIFVTSGASKVSLLVAGLKHKNSKSCIISGDLLDTSEVRSRAWSKLLPNIVSGHVFWLKEHESVQSLVGLQCDDSGYRNFAVSTTSRVLILSSALTAISSVNEELVFPALSPIGSFAVVYATPNSVKYLSCLEEELSSGSLSTLPLSLDARQSIGLLAVRQDRVLFATKNSGTDLIEYGGSSDKCSIPEPSTKPVSLLEPLVANAISIGGKDSQSTSVLRLIIERFGRFATSLTHGESEGIGSHGYGLSPRVLSALSFYGLKEPASWLLTGTVNAERVSSTNIMPQWLPIPAKQLGCKSSDLTLHALSAGDSYLSEYIKSPESRIPSSLPRTCDPTCYSANDHGREALRKSNPFDAIKLLDIVGSENVDNTISQILLLLARDTNFDVSQMLQVVGGYESKGLSSSNIASSSESVATLAMLLSERKGSVNFGPADFDRWTRPLAPSFQRCLNVKRTRQKLFGGDALVKAGETKVEESDKYFSTPCIESKHVWNEGPLREKDKLMVLGGIEDWIGSRRPQILGKAGVSAAGDRGGTQLADILNTDNDSFGDEEKLEEENDGWVDGVGEGRTDEANLSGYFRMSEGEDADSVWREEGLLDITHYQNRARIIGNSNAFALEVSTSSVDEGEPGKVKALYDLVFHKSGVGISSGLVMPCTRGSSLDVGALHTAAFRSRQKCSIEFWFYLPDTETLSEGIVLVRRTMGPSADDFSKCALANETSNVLWEIRALPTGIIEFWSCSGERVRSSSEQQTLQFGKWNHFCIVMKPEEADGVRSEISLLMKGEEIGSGSTRLLPNNSKADQSTMNDLAQKSHLYFGLNHIAGYRMTELRIWACERDPDDINALMFEYLNAAEAKKKFSVKIKKGNKGGLLAAAKPGALGVGRVTSGNLKGMQNPQKGLSISLAPKVSLAPVEEKPKEQSKPSPSFDSAILPFDSPQKELKDDVKSAFGETFAAFGESMEAPLEQLPEEVEQEAPQSLWDTALPLSEQIRASAASAIIRGPPATRHFGGNRGGLPDFQGMERYGVGGIAICGSEKTIVWRDNEDPPALTYPIGASGAIVSDQMDDEGSEFLCCFLAKEKRMVVFELQSRTVVVELQMTTKLNYWRFLPPEAGQNTLCFMLITPVGGFHWMPLEESPRPQQVWKRGPELQGKKVVNYEEGGSNGLDDSALSSRVGLVMVTKSSGDGSLEAWIVPIAGNSEAVLVSEDVMGSCFCLPHDVNDGPFLPLLLTVHQVDEGIFANLISVSDSRRGSVSLGDIEFTEEIDVGDMAGLEFEPPSLAMGTYPEAICCALANIVVVIVRRKGIVAAFELDDGELNLIAQESVGHYVIDAVMRYSAEVGGAEIVMLLADDKNPKDGRIVSFCFRSA